MASLSAFKAAGFQRYVSKSMDLSVLVSNDSMILFASCMIIFLKESDVLLRLSYNM